ncbi:sensor histidine kinase [Actinacidiphila sp. ITFR-21]|uniref:sensor histidine kinase n=1 Tax=Actinacidiphila sp. ITFR-21 TaxID=3075199 RepID=UPI00288A9461|nr:ATP-binding protein [Streptomyces sp. ITFR-21]WNI19960.1 ATP-binding protein [Streptomyces sp. ITFR-21]
MALLVRRHLLGPALAWTAAPPALWAGAQAAGHVPGTSLDMAVAVCAAAGAALSLRRGARTAASLLARDVAAREEAEMGQRRQALEFWQRTSADLHEAHVSLAGVLREQLTLHTGQDRDFRSVTAAWLDYYRRSVDGIADDVTALLADVRQGRVPQRPAFPELPPQSPGPFDGLAQQMVLLGHTVRDGVVQAAASTGTAEAELAVFAGVGNRLRSAADRVLAGLDELERSTEDPDALQAQLRIDHLVVLMRRMAEDVQVLSGGQLRSSGKPADLSTVLRQATAEIEEYGRVRIGAAAPVQVVAYARTPLIHLLAALLDNATRFSRDTVDLAGTLDASGLVITVVDAGLHMPAEDLRLLNALLADPDPVLERARLVEGRIGLLVVARLARQHRLGITLQPGAERGTRAVVTVPPKLLLHPVKPPAGAPLPVRAVSEPPAATAAAASVPVSPHPGPGGPGGLPRRHAAPGGTQPADGQGRPGLPRRRRTPAGSLPGAAPERAGDLAPATPGLAGAFLQGTRRAGDAAAGTDDRPVPAEPPAE